MRKVGKLISVYQARSSAGHILMTNSRELSNSSLSSLRFNNYTKVQLVINHWRALRAEEILSSFIVCIYIYVIFSGAQESNSSCIIHTQHTQREESFPGIR